MTVPTRKVAETFLSIIEGASIDCNWPLKDEDEVTCYYGKASLKAVKNTDYAVVLSPPNYATFSIIPLGPWIEKINALIAADPTETNYTTIRRKTDTLSSVSSSNVQDAEYLRKEIERLWLNIQELDEQISGAATLQPRYVGDVDGPITIDMPLPGKTVVGNESGTGYVAGPDAVDIQNAETHAIIATQKAEEAAASAASIGLTGTSVSNVSVASGSKSFTTQNGKSWTTGQRLRVATADASKIMEGPVASYTGTTLTISVDYTVGSGSSSAWNIGVTGERGAVGPTGATGPAGSGSGDMLKSTYDPANINQQLVGTTATQTLTNKTLTAPSINAGVVDGASTLQGYRPVNAQTGTTYSLVLADAGRCVTLNNASAITLTVPTNASQAIPVGCEIDIAQTGAGQVTLSPAGGVTLRSKSSYVKLASQYSAATLKKLGTDEWLLVGDLTS